MNVISQNTLVIIMLSLTISCGSKKEITKNPAPTQVEKEVEITINNNTKTGVDTIQKTPEIVYSFLFSQLPELSLVLDEAKKTGKKVFLDLNAEWCIPCKLMKRDVYTHKETADFFNEIWI